MVSTTSGSQGLGHEGRGSNHVSSIKEGCSGSSRPPQLEFCGIAYYVSEDISHIIRNHP